MKIQDYHHLIAARVREQPNPRGLVRIVEPGQAKYTLSISMPHVAMRLEMGHRGGKDIALPFLNQQTSGVTAKCDCIVFIPRDTAPPLALLVELKTMNQEGADHQIRCSAAFAKYLHLLAKENGWGDGGVECRGVIIWHRKTPGKLPTGGVAFNFIDYDGILICDVDRAFCPLPVNDLIHAIESEG